MANLFSPVFLSFSRPNFGLPSGIEFFPVPPSDGMLSPGDNLAAPSFFNVINVGPPRKNDDQRMVWGPTSSSLILPAVRFSKNARIVRRVLPPCFKHTDDTLGKILSFLMPLGNLDPFLFLRLLRFAGAFSRSFSFHPPPGIDALSDLQNFRASCPPFFGRRSPALVLFFQTRFVR